ncbi:restriction endonuclease subunit S [Bacillus velezensis]|uniref:restriction endonuclease subunit S n=1 Tax=Bacillus velezensis TaxID=492670 RepID=UPI0035578882
MENKRTPEVRFSGFTGEWEERELGDLVINVSRPVKMVDDDIYQLVTVKRRNGGIVSRGIFKGSEVLVKSQYLIKSGDYLISKRQVVHGANGVVPDYLDGSIVSNEYLVLHGTKDLSIDFFSIISELPSMYKNFFLSSYGVDIEKLVFNVSDWKKRKIFIPSISEQQQITLLFEEINNAIALHQQELTTLKQTKQGFLQKMFPKEGESVPEVRFPGFTGEWEECKVKDFSEETFGGGTPKTSIKEYWNGEIPWIQTSDLEEHQVSGVFAKKKITEKGLQNSATKLIPKNSIAIVTRVGVGKIALIQFEYATSQDFLSLSNLKVNEWFGVYSLYNQLQKELHNVQGTSIKGITKNELLEKKINIPTDLKEQTKIGNFFKQLDDTIALHQRELDALKETKKAFLQKMFI